MYPDIEYPKTHDDNEKIGFWNIPLIGESVEKGFSKGSFYWQLRPELVQAMEDLGLNYIPISDMNVTDELDIHYEGAKKQITVNAYERNPFARKKCIEHYGATCCICGYNFQKHFGDNFKDKIHVHHIKPLSEVNEEYEVDPIQDLIPVCPNCHFIIHSRIPAYKISEIKEHLAVSPECRRQGIATELVHLAINKQKQLNIDKCALFILNENVLGKKFWTDIGFSIVHEAGVMAISI